MIEQDLADQSVQKAAFRMVQSAARRRWAIPDAVTENAAKIAAKIAVEGKTARDRLRAIEVLATLDRANVAVLVEAHRIERLESGQSTENLAVASLTPDIIAAALGRVNDTQAGG